MPVIFIKSLPFQRERNIAAILKDISKDVSEESGVDLQHFTVTWEYLSPGHYAVSGVTEDTQPMESHPVLVDVIAPDFSSAGNKDVMLNTLANSLAKRAEVPQNNIFIQYQQAHSGMVYDGGGIVRW